MRLNIVVEKKKNKKMEVPGIWSDNLVRNFERVIEWCESVKYMSEISSKDYNLYTSKMTHGIENEHLQHAIQNHGFNFGFILKWIHLGVQSINKNPRLPQNCIITENSEFSNYEDVWSKHINNDRQVLDELDKNILSLMKNAKDKIKLFHEELSDEYSSYSDYSQDTTTDDEDDDDEEEEDDEDDDDEDDDAGKETKKKSSKNKQRRRQH